MTKSEKILKRALEMAVKLVVKHCCYKYGFDKHPGPCIYSKSKCQRYMEDVFIRKAKEELK